MEKKQPSPDKVEITGTKKEYLQEESRYLHKTENRAV